MAAHKKNTDLSIMDFGKDKISTYSSISKSESICINIISCSYL